MEIGPALELFAKIPPCALDCINTQVSTRSNCSLLDLQCSCNSKDVKKHSQKCVMDSCTNRQALVAKNITQTICGHPVRDRSATVRLSSGIYMAVAALSYLLRIASKIHIQWPWNGPFRCITQLWWDDVAMTITVLFALSQSALGKPISSPGLGKDIWTLTPPQITKFIKIFYYGELLYITGLSMVKNSMLLSYLRFFASARFRKLVWLVIATNILFMLLYDSLAAFQCIPLSYQWKEWDTGQGHVGYCWLDRQAAAWTASGFNIVFDLVVCRSTRRSHTRLLLKSNHNPGLDYAHATDLEDGSQSAQEVSHHSHVRRRSLGHACQHLTPTSHDLLRQHAQSHMGL